MTRETIPLTSTATSLLTEAEAIDRLALGDRPNPKSTIRWLVRTHKLSAVRIAKGILRYDPADLQRFIDAQRV